MPLSARWRFEMWNASTPCGARRERYTAMASWVSRCIGIASELNASSTISLYRASDAAASDSRASPSTTAAAAIRTVRET